MNFIFKKNKRKLNNLYESIDTRRIPVHVAIIMDGNGRWAKKRNLPRTLGHRAGVEAIRDVVKASSEIGIKVLTLYAFSTENWKRPADEVKSIMSLLVEYLRNELRELHNQNVKITWIGDITKLPLQCQEELKNSYNTTKNNTGLILNLALNYGGRDEIIKAVYDISKNVKEGQISIDKIDERLFSSYLFTRELPDPELIIRSSGEFRLSNFLLWQCAYSEFWFSTSDINWPDFNREHLYKAILDYQNRDRRFGGIK